MQYTLPVRAACFEWKCWDVGGQPQAVEAAVPGAGLQPREAAPGLHLGEDVHTGGCRHSADKLSVEPRHLLHDLHLSHLDVHGGKGGSSLLEDPHFVVLSCFCFSEFPPTLQSHWPLKCSLEPRPQNRIESMRATFCSRNTWLKLPPPEAPETITVSVVTDIGKWSAFSLPEILAPTPEADRRKVSPGQAGPLCDLLWHLRKSRTRVLRKDYSGARAIFFPYCKTAPIKLNTWPWTWPKNTAMIWIVCIPWVNIRAQHSKLLQMLREMQCNVLVLMCCFWYFSNWFIWCVIIKKNKIKTGMKHYVNHWWHHTSVNQILLYCSLFITSQSSRRRRLSQDILMFQGKCQICGFDNWSRQLTLNVKIFQMSTLKGTANITNVVPHYFIKSTFQHDCKIVKPWSQISNP